MKLVKTLVAAAALAVSSFTAQASVINVGGVQWDPESGFDFTAKFDFNQWFNGNELTGIGEFYKLNNTNPNVFVPNGELTFQFGGFNLVNGVFTNGWLKVYTGFGLDDDYDAGVNTGAVASDITKATNGTLWLSLVSSYNQFTSDFPNAQNPFLSGQLTVNWNVIVNQGTAWSNFNTNTQAAGTDLFSRASATFQVGQSIATLGNGSLIGDSIAAPSSLAVLGLGLLGVAGVARRKQAK